MEAHRPAGVGSRSCSVRGACDRGSKLVQAGSRDRARRDHLDAGHELLRFRDRELERLGVDLVRLRHGDDPAPDAQQPQHGQVLVRLRPRSLSRVDDEQEEIDSGRAGDHRAHEALVARHVDDRERAAVGELERRVAEVDRDPTPALFRQPVGVLARERADERRLAVVDVACRAEDDAHAK